MFSTRKLIILIAASIALAVDFDWDCTNSLAPCNNACYATNCRGVASVLNYDDDPAKRPCRRKASGCSKTPCTYTNYGYFGNSCDEYPFASTRQGGKGAILRCVDSTENSSEGGQLGNFYKNLTNGQQFGIAIRNYGGAAYCVTPKKCVNDGGEFMMNNFGQFVNARRSDQSHLFVSADSDSNEGTAFRKFMGSDGQQRIWLSKDTNGTLVGQYVWDGVGEQVLIISEIFS